MKHKGALLLGIAVLVLIVAITSNIALSGYERIIKLEKKEDLKYILRAYSRALFLYNEKFGHYPLSIKELINKKLLRKEYKSPYKNTKLKFLKNAKTEIIRVSADVTINNQRKTWYYNVKRNNHRLIYICSKN